MNYRNARNILPLVFLLLHTFLAGLYGQLTILSEGVSCSVFKAPIFSITGDLKITVIKIDANEYGLKLFCAEERKHQNLTVRQWCQQYNLLGCINAGMFQMDGKANVGYMKNYDYKNNGRINSKYQSVAVFNPKDTTETSFYMFDIDEHNMTDIIDKYHTVIQNLRLIKRPASNRWSQQNKKWSEAALGQDKDGNILFIFSRSPYSMYNFNEILKSLPINIVCAQHLEGGPEASLFFSYNDVTIEKMGSYETGFNENDNNHHFWPIPNVIGIVNKENK